MTRVIAKIYKNIREYEENKARPLAKPLRGAAMQVVFFIFPRVFVYFGYHPSH